MQFQWNSTRAGWARELHAVPRPRTQSLTDQQRESRTPCTLSGEHAGPVCCRLLVLPGSLLTPGKSYTTPQASAAFHSDVLVPRSACPCRLRRSPPALFVPTLLPV